TPGAATSALVCAVYSAMSALMSRCTSRPLYVVGATLDTPRSSSGWCATIRSAPSATASSTVSGTQSTTSSAVRTGAAGSPSASPRPCPSTSSPSARVSAIPADHLLTVFTVAGATIIACASGSTSGSPGFLKTLRTGCPVCAASAESSMNLRPSGVATTHTSQPPAWASATSRWALRAAGDPHTIRYRTRLIEPPWSYSDAHVLGELRDRRTRRAPRPAQHVREHLVGDRPAADLRRGQPVPFEQHLAGPRDVADLGQPPGQVDEVVRPALGQQGHEAALVHPLMGLDGQAALAQLDGCRGAVQLDVGRAEAGAVVVAVGAQRDGRVAGAADQVPDVRAVPDAGGRHRAV